MQSPKRHHLNLYQQILKKHCVFLFIVNFIEIFEFIVLLPFINQIYTFFFKSNIILVKIYSKNEIILFSQKICQLWDLNPRQITLIRTHNTKRITLESDALDRSAKLT
jgi:hypothetical protein